MKKKIALSFSYWKIINKLLMQSLDIEVDCKINKQHSEIFKAYCYFRVPMFRKKILTALNTGNLSMNS